MKDVPRIKAAFDWMVEHYAVDLARATGGHDAATVRRLAEAREMLSRGTFVLLFGQFEIAVTEMFERARDRRLANPDWRSRRGWDVPNLVGRRVPFEVKLALLLDRGSNAHRAALAAYSLRNHFAHGGTAAPVGSIETFVGDLYGWQAALEG